MAKKLIVLENTRFIFKTNFSGDPERDEQYHSSDRVCNIVIPTMTQAEELINMGLNVRCTKPRDGEEDGFIPTYFIKAKINIDSKWPPKIYLVTGNEEPVLLEGDSIKLLDDVYVINVNASLNPYFSERNNKWGVYVDTLYVEQDVESDPFAARYRNR